MLIQDYADLQLAYVFVHGTRTRLRPHNVGRIFGSITYLPPHRTTVGAYDRFHEERSDGVLEFFDIVLPHLYLLDLGSQFCLYMGNGPPANGNEELTPFSIFPHIYESASICTDNITTSANVFSQLWTKPLAVATEAQLLRRHQRIWSMYTTTPMIYFDHPRWENYSRVVSSEAQHLIDIRTNTDYRSWDGSQLYANDYHDPDDDYCGCEDCAGEEDLVGWGEEGMKAFLRQWSKLDLDDMLSLYDQPWHRLNAMYEMGDDGYQQLLSIDSAYTRYKLLSLQVTPQQLIQALTG